MVCSLRTYQIVELFFLLCQTTQNPIGPVFCFVFSQRHYSGGLNMSHWVCLFTTNSPKLGEEITMNCNQCSVLFHTSCSFSSKTVNPVGLYQQAKLHCFQTFNEIDTFIKTSFKKTIKDVNCCLWFIQFWKKDLIVDVYKQSSDFYKLAYLLLNCAAQTLFERSDWSPKQCPSLVCFLSICYRQWSDGSII